MAGGKRWNKDELKLAFHLYCQLPFGRLHSRNPEIQELARLLNRTPSSVAMKLVNFASLDPTITATGRTGLGNTSETDREIWNEFHGNWDALAVECHRLLEELRGNASPVTATELEDSLRDIDYTGASVRATVELRVKQGFFRRTVLASYANTCCITGIGTPALLVASHIVPWKTDPRNRLNPRNGLCLSALHDRAFDRGFIGVAEDHSVLISPALKRPARSEPFLNKAFLEFEGKKISMPEKFLPDERFLAWHRNNVFIEKA